MCVRACVRACVCVSVHAHASVCAAERRKRSARPETRANDKLSLFGGPVSRSKGIQESAILTAHLEKPAELVFIEWIMAGVVVLACWVRCVGAWTGADWHHFAKWFSFWHRRHVSPRAGQSGARDECLPDPQFPHHCWTWGRAYCMSALDISASAPWTCVHYCIMSPLLIINSWAVFNLAAHCAADSIWEARITAFSKVRSSSSNNSVTMSSWSAHELF